MPFADPFAEHGLYDVGDPYLGVSQTMGGIIRDALLTAVFPGPQLAAWMKNPLLYELGQSTVAKDVWEVIAHLGPVEKGRELLQLARTIGLSRYVTQVVLPGIPSFVTTIRQGLTPAAHFLRIGGVHAADAAGVAFRSAWDWGHGVYDDIVGR